MKVDIEEAKIILGRTPETLDVWLRDVPEPWLMNNVGGESWSPFHVVGHLIHGEKTDWIPRAKIILEQGELQAFEPFDRFAQLTDNVGRGIAELLDEFATLRRKNLGEWRSLNVTPKDLTRKGRHPDFGSVTLGELLATWVAHDLGHIAQVARTMAQQYQSEVGPWREYLPVLNR
jgi:hypothetical protein